MDANLLELKRELSRLQRLVRNNPQLLSTLKNRIRDIENRISALEERKRKANAGRWK